MQTSWLSTVGPAALFDELSKIAAAETPKHTWKDTARTIGAGVLGGGLGLATVQGLGSIPSVKRFLTTPTKSKQMAAKVILPILGGAALMLADRYRKRMDEGMFGKPAAPSTANQKK